MVPRIRTNEIRALMGMTETDTPNQLRRALGGIYGARKGVSEALRKQRNSMKALAPEGAMSAKNTAAKMLTELLQSHDMPEELKDILMQIAMGTAVHGQPSKGVAPPTAPPNIVALLRNAAGRMF